MPDLRSFSSGYDRWHKMLQLEKSSATQVCGLSFLRFAQACRWWSVSQHTTRNASHCNKTIVNFQRITQVFWTWEAENLHQVFNARRQTVSLFFTTHSPRYLSPGWWNYRPFCSSWPTPTCLSVINVLSATLTTQIHAKLKHGFLVIVIAGILYTIV